MKRLLCMLILAAMVGAAFALGVTAQTDEALVPFIVNVNATVKAEFTDGYGDITSQVQVSATANVETILRIPLSSTSILKGSQRQSNVPTIIRNRSGKVTINLPAQSYGNAEVLLYTVNGKRILRHNVSASNGVNNIPCLNITTGVYLLSIKGTDGNALTSRLTHSGGNLDIDIGFGSGSENRSSAHQLTKETAGTGIPYRWRITVRGASEYSDTTYWFNPVSGMNPLQYITLLLPTGTPGTSNTLDTPTDVTATAGPNSSITVSWSPVARATGYSVLRKKSDDRYESEVYTTSTSYIDKGLSIGTTYYYRVAASNNNEGSDFSEYVSATPLTFTYGGQIYRAVKIGDKIWMAENLNVETSSGSWCYKGYADNCAKYGRLYNWETAKTACPSGWHLPSISEWGQLAIAAGGTDTYGTSGPAGKKLKSTTDWDYAAGTDDFGFSALPGGMGNLESNLFGDIGSQGYWWTTGVKTDGGFQTWAYYRYIDNRYDVMFMETTGPSWGLSVRCVK